MYNKIILTLLVTLNICATRHSATNIFNWKRDREHPTITEQEQDQCFSVLQKDWIANKARVLSIIGNKIPTSTLADIIIGQDEVIIMRKFIDNDYKPTQENIHACMSPQMLCLLDPNGIILEDYKQALNNSVLLRWYYEIELLRRARNRNHYPDPHIFVTFLTLQDPNTLITSNICNDPSTVLYHMTLSLITSKNQNLEVTKKYIEAAIMAGADPFKGAHLPYTSAFQRDHQNLKGIPELIKHTYIETLTKKIHHTHRHAHMSPGIARQLAQLEWQRQLEEAQNK